MTSSAARIRRLAPGRGARPPRSWIHQTTVCPLTTHDEVASTFTGSPDLATGKLPCGPDGIGTIKVVDVVLTVAHLDAQSDVCQCEEETGSKCANPDHVLALCQRCHLTYDARRHSFNGRRTRATEAGQMWLGDIEHRHAASVAG